MEQISQIAILILGSLAIWLVGRPEKWGRWGYIMGLCSQPFWLWTTFQHKQWGIFALAIWYTYCWGQGIYFRWIKTQEN